MTLEEILKKDGKEWTLEESKFVAEAIKKSGRSVLKSIRKDLRSDSIESGA